jgi:hypothetical protein
LPRELSSKTRNVAVKRNVGSKLNKIRHMNILHNQSQLNRLLILGILYIIVGLLSIATSAKLYLSGLTGIGIIYVAQYFYTKNRAYVILTENTVSTNGLFKKEIEVKDIKSMKYFAGDYIIKSAGKEIIIDTNLVDKESQTKLKSYFENLKL